MFHLRDALRYGAVGQNSGCECGMLGAFVFCDTDDEGSVRVALRRTPAGERVGQVLLPGSVAFELAQKAYPSVAQPLPLPSAFSYAVYLAMTTGLPLRVTGDASVWDDRWGPLIASGTVGLVSALDDD